MRVLMTTDTVGGVWTFTQELTAGLLARGSAVCLASLGRRPSMAHQEWCTRMRRQWRDSFHFLALDAPLEWMQENDLAWDEAAPQLMQAAHRFGADIVHSNQFCFGALPVDCPIVVTAHSDVLSWARACRGGNLEATPWLRRYLTLVQQGLSRAQAVVVPTQWMADSLQQDYRLPAQPVVIADGRTLPFAGDRNRKTQAVTAGRLWDEGKNVEMLAEIEAPLPIILAGECDPQRAAGFRRQAGFTCAGPLASDALIGLFRESAVYLCTSRYEPFGLAPLEAALCGCAVLAYELPSLQEVWQSAALYFHNAASLTQLLRRLCNNPAELSAAQERAMRRAREFSAERMVERYETYFHQSIAQACGGTELCTAS